MTGLISPAQAVAAEGSDGWLSRIVGGGRAECGFHGEEGELKLGLIGLICIQKVLF
jgi:hypothetical protein